MAGELRVTEPARREAHESRIRAMFDAIAPVYDRLNHTLSLGQDIAWRRAAALRARLAEGEVALDVGAGTGDLALALLEASAPGSRVVGLDLSDAMFAIASEKLARRGYAERFRPIRGSVLAIPAPDASFDRVVSAFTMRNVADLPAACREMRRVLRAGGRLVLLELAKPGLPLFAAVYNAYFHGVLPRLAALLGGDPAAYAYLPRSLAPFPDPPAFAGILEDAGFRDVRYAMLALGIAAIHEGAA